MEGGVPAFEPRSTPVTFSGDMRWRTDNIGRLLFSATDRFVRDKLALLHARGAAIVSGTMMALLLNLDREGVRLTTLAERSGQTKQSVAELVDRAETLGLVERLIEPVDRRARVVRFTEAGFALLDQLEQCVEEADRRFSSAVGETFTAELKTKLDRYVREHDPLRRPAAGDARGHVPVRARGWNAGYLLATAARCFALDLLASVHEHGHEQVSNVLLTLLRSLDLTGTRLTDLAARARMTKQSMRELVDRGEALGLVTRRADPVDRRAKTIMFTTDGLALLDDIRWGAARAEERFRRSAGEAFADALIERIGAYLNQAEWAGVTSL